MKYIKEIFAIILAIILFPIFILLDRDLYRSEKEINRIKRYNLLNSFDENKILLEIPDNLSYMYDNMSDIDKSIISHICEYGKTGDIIPLSHYLYENDVDFIEYLSEDTKLFLSTFKSNMRDKKIDELLK